MNVCFGPTAETTVVAAISSPFSRTTAATAFFDRPFFGVGVIPVELQEFLVE